MGLWARLTGNKHSREAFARLLSTALATEHPAASVSFDERTRVWKIEGLGPVDADLDETYEAWKSAPSELRAEIVDDVRESVSVAAALAREAAKAGQPPSPGPGYDVPALSNFSVEDVARLAEALQKRKKS